MMRFTVSIVLLLLGIATTVFGQTDQRAVAAQLLSASRDVRDKAVTAVRNMRPDEVGPEVRTALITLLERLNAVEEKARAWYAMDLAIALSDSELRRIVQDLADHASESHRRGITNGEVPDLLEKTQKRAADRLAGLSAATGRRIAIWPRAS